MVAHHASARSGRPLRLGAVALPALAFGPAWASDPVQDPHAQWRGSVGGQGAWQSAVSAGLDGRRVSLRANLALRRDRSRKIRQSMLDWRDVQTGADRQIQQSSSVLVRRATDSAGVGADLVNDVLLTSKQNGGRSRSVGINTTLDWKINGAVQAGIDGGVYRTTLSALEVASDTLATAKAKAKATAAGRVLPSRQAVSGYLKLRATLKAGASDVALDADVQSSGVNALGRYGATSSVNLGWKSRYSKTVSLTVNANDLFDGSRRSYASQTGALRQSGLSILWGEAFTSGW